MTPGLYSTVSALTSRWNQQELSAKNISNVNVAGHKREVAGFAAFLKTSLNDQQPVTAPSLTCSQPAAFDLAAGGLRETGCGLDAAISGEGFFEVQTSAGPRLTRNGHFKVNASHQLVDDADHAVQGQRGAITVPDGDVRLAADGSVTVNGKAVDKVRIVAAPRPDQLQSDGGILFAPKSGVQLADAKDVKLAVGAVEMSNVTLPMEMAQMIQNQRVYDMLTRSFQMQDDAVGRAIQELGTV
jgi:flagellar basal body rod protein FlgG